MVYLESPSTDPHFNLALEQYVFDEMNPTRDYFMLWQNDNAIIVGKYQNTAEEINQTYVREHGIHVVRRLSGGGAVYHDMGNLNFTFITDAGDSSTLDFSVFCKQIAEALAAFGIKAEIGGRNDITIEGRKFSGNSQYIKRKRVMHHGTILYDSNLAMIAGALNVPKDKFESKSIKSVRGRVANVKEFMKQDIPLEQFKTELVKHMFGTGRLTEHHLAETDMEKVRDIQKNRYDLWAWNYGASPGYAIGKRRKIEGCGTITLHMEVEKGAITAFRATGDYFGNGDPDEFAAKMVGLQPEAGVLRTALAGVDIGHYFSGVQLEDYLRLVLE